MAINVVASLRAAGRDDEIIGQSSAPVDRFFADVDSFHLVPRATSPGYRAAILSLLSRTRPSFLLATHDFEVRALSRLRDELAEIGVELALPSAQAVEACVDKFRSYQLWAAAGLPVPETMLIREPADLETAMERLGGAVWLRAIEGGGGSGALPTDSLQLARAWIDRADGWGRFTAGRVLASRTTTWQSLWWHGELAVAQTRRRLEWAFGNRSPAGVTGVTRLAVTTSDPAVDRLASAAVRAVDAHPHGLFGVDMTDDHESVPHVTEINIGRFFTTINFFTTAGLNLPAIFRDLIVDGRFPELERRCNPLPDGLVWARAMDALPVLTSLDELRAAGWRDS